MLKRAGVATISAWAAHALAWGVGLYMVFGPAYQGVSTTATAPGEPETNVVTTGHTQTLVEANSLWVIWILLVPIPLSGLALLTIRFTDTGQARRKALLWLPAVVLLAFCAVAIASIGCTCRRRWLSGYYLLDNARSGTYNMLVLICSIIRVSKWAAFPLRPGEPAGDIILCHVDGFWLWVILILTITTLTQ